jgi:peptide/nickel transport system permease protein
VIARLIIRRLFFLILVLFGLSLITFTLSHLVPADPARMIAGPRASKSAVEKIREDYGLNDPLPVQYVDYVKGKISAAICQPRSSLGSTRS